VVSIDGFSVSRKDVKGFRMILHNYVSLLAVAELSLFHILLSRFFTS